MRFWIRDRRRTGYKFNVVVPQSSAYAPQTSHDHSDMRAEKSIVNMKLVDDYEFQVLQEEPPCFFLG